MLKNSETCTTVKDAVRYYLFLQENDHWKSEVHKKSKLDFYQLITEFRSFPIADCVNMRRLRSFLCNLTSGTLPLRIETGRYSNEPRNDRWCRVCNNPNEIEDAIHFLAVYISQTQ